MERLQSEMVDVINKKSDCAFDISAQMEQLKIVQGAVSGLVERLDEVLSNKWHEDRGMAYMSIIKISDEVRLIDMAFRPLLSEMSEEVRALVGYTELFDEAMREKMGV